MAAKKKKSQPVKWAPKRGGSMGGQPLRARVKAEIKASGLVRTATRIGVMPDTLQRFVQGTSSHRGTVALIEKAYA